MTAQKFYLRKHSVYFRSFGRKRQLLQETAHFVTSSCA